MTRSVPISRAGRGRAARPGFSLVEVTLSIVIVGMLAASTFTAVGLAAKRAVQSEESERAAWLARDLMAEIASRPCDFVLADVPLGGLQATLGGDGRLTALTDLTGTPLTSRSSFNDIFDYDNWTSTPPVDVDGHPIAGYDRWTRSVDVDCIDPATLATRAFDARAAKIVVTVRRGARVLHTETLVRTQQTDTLREPAAGTDSPLSGLVK